MLGKEVDPQISVLTSGTRGGDTDNLARTTLKDQQITSADVVAWDSDGVWADASWGSRRGGRGSYGNVNLFPINVVVVMMLASEDTISSSVQSVTEGVVVT